MVSVYYLAHPLSGDIDGNIKSALNWLSWAERRWPDCAIIAPWIASVLAGANDSDADQRDRGLRDDVAVVSRCDGIILCGGRVSSGMHMEMDAARSVIDLTYLGPSPTGVTTNPYLSFEDRGGSFCIVDGRSTACGQVVIGGAALLPAAIERLVCASCNNEMGRRHSMFG